MRHTAEAQTNPLPSGKTIVPTTKDFRKNYAPAVRVPEQYFSRAVSKALQTLELLAAGQGPMSLQDIAAGIQLSKASALRLLRTLEAAGYLMASGWGRYALAPGTHSVVSTQFLARLIRVATPRMEEVGHELGETLSLAALFENRVEVIAVTESTQMLRMSNVVGHILPPSASSLGKAISAFQSAERREKLLRSYGFYRFTEHSITDRNELQREFAQVRTKGFAVDREESVYEGNCFGVPIFDGTEVTAAMSVSMPKARVRDAAHERQIVEKLKEVAALIGAGLHTPPAPAPSKSRARR